MTGFPPIWFCGAAFSLLLVGCGPFYEEMAERRNAYAEAGEGSIVVAVIDDGPDSTYLDGARLALDRLNTTDGGLLGRRVELLVHPGSDDFDTIRSTVLRVAGNPQVIAALGHKRSSVAVPASAIYEKAEVLFMPPFASSEQLTLHGFNFVLRMLPDNKIMTAQSASLASLFGYRRMAVLHARDDYSREVAFLFEDAARRFGIDITFRGSFFGAETNYRDLIGQLNGVDFDAIYLATDSEPGARILRQLRELGLRQPVLGSDTLNFGSLAKLAGSAGDRTIVPTVFSPGDQAASKQRFEQAYVEAYERAPTQAAAQGYDGIEILSTIIKRAGSTVPGVLATTAHHSPPMAGVTGIYAFDPRGDIFGKSYRFQVLRFGRWWSLPGVTIPFLLARFEEEKSKEAANAAAEEDANTAAVAETNGGTAADPGETTRPAADSAAQDVATQGGDPGAEVPAPGQAASGEQLDLAALTSGRLSIIERNQIWLVLAHEIIGFKHLGLVAAPTESGGAAAIGLARTVAERRGFSVEICSLPDNSKGHANAETNEDEDEGDADQALIDRSALRRAALVCYSRLSRKVDAMLVVLDSGLSASYLNQLNRGLRHFGVPSFALAHSIDADYGLTLALTSSDVDLDDPNVALRFNGLLKSMRVHELNQKFANLPSVSVDLDALADLDIRPAPSKLTVISNVLESSPPTPLTSIEEPN